MQQNNYYAHAFPDASADLARFIKTECSAVFGDDSYSATHACRGRSGVFVEGGLTCIVCSRLSQSP